MINCINVCIASRNMHFKISTKRALLFTLVVFITVTCPLFDYVVGCTIGVLLLGATDQSNRTNRQPTRAGVTNLFRQARSSLS